MKAVNAALLSHIASQVTTLAICWKVTTRTNVVFGFTGHDQDITVLGVTYLSAYGITPTDVETKSGMSVDTVDLDSFLNVLGITDTQIQEGLFDDATVEVFVVNYADLTQGILKLRKGFLGQTSHGRLKLHVEIRGLMEAYMREVGELYSPTCRADLGDTRCGVTLATYTVTGSATSATNRRVFQDTTRSEADGYFLGGLLTWTSGLNTGLQMEVKQWTLATKEFELVLPMPYGIAATDAYSVHAGCDKTVAVCRDTFNNILNFRGEPYVPQTQEAAISSVR